MTRINSRGSDPSFNPYQPAASLDEARAGTRFIHLGAEGESVRAVQRALRASGANIEVDGQFGPETEAAVRSFQARRGLEVDGVVGPQTMGRLQPTAPRSPPAELHREGVASAPREGAPRPAGTLRAGALARDDELRRRAPGRVSLAPANATPEQRYDHYAAIVRANGGQLSENGQATVLGLRGLSRSDGAHETTSSRRYDDTFVVLKDGRAYELQGATHAGQTTSSLSPDVSRDGRGDVGMINPGNYVARPNGLHSGAASWWVQRQDGNGRLPGVRDTNHDGRFSDAELAASARRGDTLGEVLFHRGGQSAPISIGCMTLPPNVYDDFIRHVGGSGRGFSYTLVDAQR